MLAGTIREQDTHKRRPFLRFFVCQEDISLQSPDAPLPAAVAEGKEPLLIIGAIAGG
jgi:sulfur-carrier protein